MGFGTSGYLQQYAIRTYLARLESSDLSLSGSSMIYCGGGGGGYIGAHVSLLCLHLFTGRSTVSGANPKWTSSTGSGNNSTRFGLVPFCQFPLSTRFAFEVGFG